MLINNHLILLQFHLQMGRNLLPMMGARPLVRKSTLHVSIHSQPSCMNIVYKLATKQESSLQRAWK